MEQEDAQLRFRLTIAYDGSNYAGWQVQPKDVGVQQRVEEALQKLFPGVKRVHSSSRTDTGVHALGMVAHFDVAVAAFRMPVRKLRLALNAYLPEDIRVREAVRCPNDFHARFDSRGKQYRYYVWNHPAMNPLMVRHAWHVPVRLDIPKMRQAARAFVGLHDFRSLAANRIYEVEDTVRTITRCELKRSGPLLTFVMQGDGFLYKMCRAIVGTLVQVGKGKYRVDSVPEMLAAEDRRSAGMTAPAQGLILWKVFYSEATDEKQKGCVS